MAESELGVLSFQCLDRRIPDQQMLKEEVDAWEAGLAIAVFHVRLRMDIGPRGYAVIMLQ